VTTLPAPLRPQLGPHSTLRLLVIEDSRSDSDLVLALLEDELPQAHVDVAVDLHEALRLLGKSKYDATLADLSLPDADGLAVVRAVRTNHPETALLVLTGRADGELDLWALAEGAQDYLIKGRDDGPRLATALLHALQRQRAEREAHGYLQLARGLLDALESPTCAVGADSVIVAVNKSWNEFMTSSGGDADECGEGSNYLAACHRVGPNAGNTGDAGEVAAGLAEVLAGRLDRFQFEYPSHSPEEDRWYSARITPAEIDGTSGAVINHVDVSAMHRAQQVLSHQTMHDDLTGLPNRLLLSDRLDQALADSVRRGRDVGVVFLDLDHFKLVNDSLGHNAGDELLIQVTGRLQHQIRATDTLCRYSGDEYVIVWRDLNSPAEAIMLGERLTECFVEPFMLGGTPVDITASIGITVGRSPKTSETLLQSADMAMYDAKRHGRGNVCIFTDELRERMQKQMVTELELRGALQRSELVLHYQPVMDLTTGLPVAVEALVRWQHPQRGLLSPAEFIPVAESSGLILPLDRWVLEQACHDAASFTCLAEGLLLAVNMSARQLTQPDVPQHVKDVLDRTELDAHRLILEITESTLMEDEHAAATALRELSRLGVRIAIDDFGTGFSSLLYLRRYPISTIKLDRAFVSDICSNQDDEAISRSVISLARSVQATCIAEGVETPQQYAALREMGCQQAQGFLWSPAVSIDSLRDTLLACVAVPTPPPTIKAPPAVEHPVEARVAARIQELHTAGASLHTIAASLNLEGTADPHGVPWTATSIARNWSP
jgi:diguanylate cyclase (GGDEF)-like protein